MILAAIEPSARRRDVHAHVMVPPGGAGGADHADEVGGSTGAREDAQMERLMGTSSRAVSIPPDARPPFSAGCRRRGAARDGHVGLADCPAPAEHEIVSLSSGAPSRWPFRPGRRASHEPRALCHRRTGVLHEVEEYAAACLRGSRAGARGQTSRRACQAPTGGVTRGPTPSSTALPRAPGSAVRGSPRARRFPHASTRFLTLTDAGPDRPPRTLWLGVGPRRLTPQSGAWHARRDVAASSCTRAR